VEYATVGNKKNSCGFERNDVCKKNGIVSEKVKKDLRICLHLRSCIWHK